MPEVIPDSQEPAQEQEKRQFHVTTGEDSLFPGDHANTPLSYASIDGAAAEATPVSTIELAPAIIEAEIPFEDYDAPGEVQDFGALPDEIANRLEGDHIVILYGSESRLSDLAFSVACLHYSAWNQLAYDPRPRNNSGRIEDIRTIRDLIHPKLMPKVGQTLMVIQDLNMPNLSPLSPGDYVAQRARTLLDELKRRTELRVLVLTQTATWRKLLACNGTRAMEAVGKKIDLPLGETGAADPSSLRSRLHEVITTHGKPGLITAWCAALLSNASLDDIVLAAESMIRCWKRKDEELPDVLEKWRMSFSAILASVGARQVERSQTVTLEFPDGAWDEELRRLLRIEFRMQHLEAMGLLRQSGVLLRAEPELLQVFAISIARLAREERQPGKNVLVYLIEEWLQKAPDERTLFVLTAVFCAIVRDDQPAFASDVLATLPGNGYPEAAAAILARCPPRFLMQPWFLSLYNRLLPSQLAEVRLELWSRLIRLSAKTVASIGEVVTLAQERLSRELWIEFVARFVEEVLLGDREQAGRLLELLRNAQADPTAPGRLIFDSIRSAEFRAYADRRATKWAPRNENNALFDTWIVRTLIPIVPSVTPRNVFHLFSQALYNNDVPRPARANRPSYPTDQMVGMLLVDFSAEIPTDSEWAPLVTAVLEAVIPDQSGAIATYDTFRTLSERFNRVSRVLSTRSPTETSIHMNARDAITRFFYSKSETVDRLRRLIEAKYF